MTELLNYVNEIEEVKKKLATNLNTMGVYATTNESFMSLVDKVLLVSIDNPSSQYTEIVARVTEQDEILTQAQGIVDSINCNS